MAVLVLKMTCFQTAAVTQSIFIVTRRVKICVKQHYFEEVIKEDQECYERYEDMCNAYNMEFY